MVTIAENKFEILDLRQVSSTQLAPLLEEERAAWREQLRWDYRPSVVLIKRHIDARSLPGYVALAASSGSLGTRRVAGYSFFVYEDHKGLLGDLYVGRDFLPAPVGAAPQAGLASKLLEHTLETLEATPGLTRIEAQPIPFGIEPLAPIFLAHNFSSYPRLFMYKPLDKTSGAKAPTGESHAFGTTEVVPHTEQIQEPSPAPPARGKARPPAEGAEWEMQQWEDRFFEPMAELTVSAYRGHVDSRINDQYCSRQGALKFLKNIVVFPGCGMFQPEASFVTLARHTGQLAGAILVSQVAARVAHITQVCVRRQLQGCGIGRHLLVRALNHLRQRGYEGVSLSVTAENQPAVRLYRRFGFDILKGYAAFVWEKLPIVD